MSLQYTVALVLDPEFGDRLNLVAARTHVWAVGTPTNRGVAEEMWEALPKPFEYSIESGVTTFDPALGAGPEEWCKAILGTIDQHHDDMSHGPGYSVLEVYGLQFNERLHPVFGQLGFSLIEETRYGFRAIKSKR